MSKFHLEYLNRSRYITSIATIKDARTLKFANMSLNWWDKQFGWYTKGCIVLCNEENEHLSYVFFKISRTNEYITIHNIFTQFSLRRNGYAYELLKLVFAFALTLHVKRIKLTSISNSLDFYLALGFVYWGVNSVGDYYCDLPMPFDGLDGMHSMIETATIETLLGRNFQKIHDKVVDNNTHLSDMQTIIYKNDLEKMGVSYMLKELLDKEITTI